jgi:uncharacterized DUF497 family protein
VLIIEFEWDDNNISHLSRHRILPEDVDAMLTGRITVVRNKKATGEYRFAGRGRGGTRLTIVVVGTGVPGRWRPITGLRK